MVTTTSEGAAAAPTPRTGVGPAALAWVAALLVVTTAHVWVALDAVAPVQTKDEIGYLAAARWLATGEGAGLLTPEYAGGYAVGWGLLTAPLWWISGHPPSIYAASVAVNVVLSVLLLVPAAAVGRRLGLTSRQAVLVAGVVCLGAGRLGYTGYALPEALLTLQLTTLLWLLLRLAAADPAPWGVPATSVLLAWLVTTHARFAPMAALGLALLAWWAWQRRSAVDAAAVTAGTALAAAGWWLNGHVETVLYGDVARVAVAADQVGGLAVADVLALLVGHAWYAAVAWLGLAVLGWLVAAGAARGELTARSPGPWLWLVTGSLLQLGVGAAYLSTRLDDGGRVDQLVYGRYGDPVWFLLALVGAAALLARPRPLQLLVTALAVVVGLALAARAALWSTEDRVAGFVQLNVPGLEAWAWRQDGVFVVPWAQATVVAILTLGALTLVVLPSPAAKAPALAGLGVVLVALAVVAEERNIEPRDAWIRSLFAVREVVEQEPDAAVLLVVDRPLLLSGNALQWWLADRDTTVVEPGPLPADVPAGSLVVAPTDLPPTGAAVALLGSDATGTYGVWRITDERDQA